MPKFIVDDQVFDLAELLAANEHDPEVCAWLRTAKPGDEYLGCLGTVAATCCTDQEAQDHG